jgi:hypothetical protein
MATGLENKFKSHDCAGEIFTGTGRNGEEKLANRISSERSAACRATPTQRVLDFVAVLDVSDRYSASLMRSPNSPSPL